MPNNSLASVPLLGILFLLTMNGAAEVYQWTDDNGRMHFGDKPPGEHAKIITIKEKTFSESEKKTLDERRKKQLKLLEFLQEERLYRKYTNQQEKEFQRNVKAECDKTEAYRHKATNSHYLYEEDEKGNRRILNEKEYEAHIHKLNQYLKENC